MREALIIVGIVCATVGAAVAITHHGGPAERELSYCYNTLNGWQVVVYSDTLQMPLMYEDGSEAVIDASGPQWRCEPRPAQ